MILGTQNSCYFHAVLRAYNESYIENENVDYRTGMARTLRNLLAEKLDSRNIQGERIYDLLSQGTFKSYSEAVPEYSLDQMISMLTGNEQVDHRFQELLCEVLELDIYMVDGKTRDIYRLCNEEIYIKNRPSVVLIYEPGHYSLLGRPDEDRVMTKFSPNDELIKALKLRIRTKSKE